MKRRSGADQNGIDVITKKWLENVKKEGKERNKGRERKKKREMTRGKDRKRGKRSEDTLLGKVVWENIQNAIVTQPKVLTSAASTERPGYEYSRSDNKRTKLIYCRTKSITLSHMRLTCQQTCNGVGLAIFHPTSRCPLLPDDTGREARPDY